jgi:hypothetical protein
MFHWPLLNGITCFWAVSHINSEWNSDILEPPSPGANMLSDCGLVCGVLSRILIGQQLYWTNAMDCGGDSAWGFPLYASIQLLLLRNECYDVNRISGSWEGKGNCSVHTGWGGPIQQPQHRRLSHNMWCVMASVAVSCCHVLVDQNVEHGWITLALFFYC